MRYSQIVVRHLSSQIAFSRSIPGLDVVIPGMGRKKLLVRQFQVIVLLFIFFYCADCVYIFTVSRVTSSLPVALVILYLPLLLWLLLLLSFIHSTPPTTLFSLMVWHVSAVSVWLFSSGYRTSGSTKNPPRRSLTRSTRLSSAASQNPSALSSPRPPAPPPPYRRRLHRPLNSRKLPPRYLTHGQRLRVPVPLRGHREPPDHL